MSNPDGEQPQQANSSQDTVQRHQRDNSRNSAEQQPQPRGPAMLPTPDDQEYLDQDVIDQSSIVPVMVDGLNAADAIEFSKVSTMRPAPEYLSSDDFFLQTSDFSEKTKRTETFMSSQIVTVIPGAPIPVGGVTAEDQMLCLRETVNMIELCLQPGRLPCDDIVQQPQQQVPQEQDSTSSSAQTSPIALDVNSAAFLVDDQTNQLLENRNYFVYLAVPVLIKAIVNNSTLRNEALDAAQNMIERALELLIFEWKRFPTAAVLGAGTKTEIKDRLLRVLDGIKLILDYRTPYARYALYGKNSQRLQSDLKVLSQAQQDPRSTWRESPQNFVFACPPASAVKNAELSYFKVQLINLFGRLGGFSLWSEWLHACMKPVADVTLGILHKLMIMFIYTTDGLKQSLLEELTPVCRNFAQAFITGLDDEAIKSRDKKQFTDFIEYIAHVYKRQNMQAKFDETKELLQLELCSKYVESSLLDKRINGLQEIKQLIRLIVDNEDPRHQASSRNFSTPGSTSPMNYSTQTESVAPKFIDKKYLVRWLEQRKVLDSIFCRDVHTELIRQSRPILLFIAENSGLQQRDIDNIWRAAVGKHEATQRAIYELIVSIVQSIKPQSVNAFFSCIESIQLAQLNQHTIQFIEQFTVEATNNPGNTKLGPKKRKWFGLDIFWQLMQDNVRVALPVANLGDMAAVCLRNILRREEFESQRKRFIKACLENVRLGQSVPQSLTLLRQIVASLPHDSRKKPKSKKLSLQGMLDHLQDKYKLVDVFFEDVRRYKRVTARASFAKDKRASSRTLGSLIPVQQEDRPASWSGASPDHRLYVSESLNFLTFVINNTDVQLSFEQVMDLWHSFYEQATDDSERRIFTKWLESGRRSRTKEQMPLLSDAVAERFFRDVVLKIDAAKATNVSFDLFFSLFIDVNCRCGKLQVTFEESSSVGSTTSLGSQPLLPAQPTKSLQMLGQPPSIEVTSTDNKSSIVKQDDAVSWTDKISSKIDKLQGKLSEFVSRRRFLGSQTSDDDHKPYDHEDLQPKKRELKSMSVLDNDLIGEDFLWDVALHADEPVSRSAIRNLNSLKSNFAVELRQRCGEYRQLHVDKCMRQLQAAAIRLLDQKSIPEGKDRLRAEETHALNRQAQRCLEILLDFVIIFADKSILRGHGVASVGVPLTLRITAVDSKQKFKVVAQSTDTVARLQQLVSSEINHSSSMIRLYVNGQALDDPTTVLDDLRIKNGHVVLAKVTDTREACLVLVQHQLRSLGLSPVANAISRQISERYQQALRTNSEDASVSSSISTSNGEEALLVQDQDGLAIAFASDDRTLPMSILSREQNFQSIMKLLDLDGCVAEKAWTLILHLPTNAQMRDALQGVIQWDAQVPQATLNWDEILPRGSIHRLLYSLQIVDMILKRSKGHADTCGQSFVAQGGFDHLLSILMQTDLLNMFSKTALHKECLAYLIKTVEAFLPAYLDKVPNREAALAMLQSVIDVALTIPTSFDIAELNSYALKEKQQNAASSSEAAEEQAPKHQEQSAESAQVTKQSTAPMAYSIGVAYRAAISQTISFLVTCISVMPETAAVITKHARLNDFIRDSLFCEFKDIRHEVLQGIRKLLMQGGTSVGIDIFIPLLFSFIQLVPVRYDHTCEQYFMLLTELIEKASVPIQGFDIPQAITEVVTMIVKRPIYELSSAATCEDKVLVGLLLVCRRLLRHAQDIKAQIGSKQSVGLVKEVFDYVFEAPSVSSAVHLTEIRGTKRRCLPPKCKTVASRTAAFELLVELVENCRENFEELIALIGPYISVCVRHSTYNFEPKNLEKNALGYVGLKNLGATCYANSLLQQLFMIQPLRRGLLSVHVTDPAKDDNHSLLYQFQILLGFLQDSAKRFYDTKPLFAVYKDVDGSTLSPGMQQDANEFSNFFLDKIEAALKDTPQRHLLQHVFGGKLLNQLLYEEHVSETEEPFFALSLEIKNKHNILESLSLYTQGEMLEGANQYYSDKLKRHVDAVKRALVKELPNVLLLHLKRFEYDYERMRNLKINDRCEFPMDLDMEPYTLEGVFRREKRDMSHLPKRDPSYYKYRLVGVLVHTGTADSGHYYSFIMDRQASTEAGTEQWFEFNDTNVYKFNTAELEKECFGGDYTLGESIGIKKQPTSTRLQRSNNAYILFYQRTSTLDKDIAFDDQSDHVTPTEGVQPQASTQTLVALQDDGTNTEQMESVQNNTSKLSSAITALRFLVKLNAKARDRQQQLQRLVDLPDYVKQTIWQDNALFYYDRNVFNAEFEAFLWNFMTVRERLVSAAGQQSVVDEVAKPLSLLDDTAIVELILRYILDILSHGADTEALTGKWFDFMSAILERSKPACRCFLSMLSSNQVWCLEAFLRCPYSSLRFSFSNLAIICIKMIRSEEKYLRRKSIPADSVLVKNSLALPSSAPSSEQSDSVAQQVATNSDQEEETGVLQFMEAIVALLSDTRYFPDRAAELFQFLAKFALLGYNERKYLAQKEIISLLVSLLSSDFQPQQQTVGDRALGYAAGGRMLPASKSHDSMFIFGKQALHHIVSLISLVIRFCETSALKNVSTPLPPKMMRRADELPVDISNKDRDRLFHRPFFASLIVEGTNLQAIGEMVAHWSWYNLSVSMNFCKLVLESLREHSQHATSLSSISNAASTDNSAIIQNFLTVLEQLLTINDDIAATRVQQILDKYAETLDALKSQANVALQLLNFLTRTAKFSELVKSWLLNHFQDLEAVCRIHGWALKQQNNQNQQQQAPAKTTSTEPPAPASTASIS